MQPDESPPAPAADVTAARALPSRPRAAGAVAAAADSQAGQGAASAGPAARLVGARDLVPWLIALAVFAAYTTISVYRYLRLDPASWDLGVFTEYVKQLAHFAEPIVNIRAPGFNLLGDHFDPIVALLAPFFRLFPSAVTLLVAQAALAAISVLAVSRAAAVLLGRGASRAIGAAYGFSWGLQQLVNYDFHELAFAVPLLACSLSALVRGQRRAAALWALPLVFVKEDQGLTVAAIGLVMMMLAHRAYVGGRHQPPTPPDAVCSGTAHPRIRQPEGHNPPPGLPMSSARAAAHPRIRQRDWWGPLLIGWGLGWSLLAIEVIIPHFNAAHQYPYWAMGGAISPHGHLSVGAVAGQLVTGSSVKLPTLVLTLLVTAFVAIRSPILLVAVPNLLLRFVSTNSIYWGTAWHYSAPLMPIVFIAAIDGLARIAAAQAAGRATRVGVVMQRHGPAAMLAICAALAFSFPLSQLWSPQTYQLGGQVAAARAAMARVPDGVTVATDLDLLAALAGRTDTFWLGNAGNPATQYVVFDTHSTDWQPPPKNVLAFVEQRFPGATYRQIFTEGGVYVFRLTRRS
jgi:uncharacterized membrane protein